MLPPDDEQAAVITNIARMGIGAHLVIRRTGQFCHGPVVPRIAGHALPVTRPFPDDPETFLRHPCRHEEPEE